MMKILKNFKLKKLNFICFYIYLKYNNINNY